MIRSGSLPLSLPGPDNIVSVNRPPVYQPASLAVGVKGPVNIGTDVEANGIGVDELSALSQDAFGVFHPGRHGITEVAFTGAGWSPCPVSTYYFLVGVDGGKSGGYVAQNRVKHYQILTDRWH